MTSSKVINWRPSAALQSIYSAEWKNQAGLRFFDAKSPRGYCRRGLSVRNPRTLIRSFAKARLQGAELTYQHSAGLFRILVFPIRVWHCSQKPRTGDHSGKEKCRSALPDLEKCGKAIIFYYITGYAVLFLKGILFDTGISGRQVKTGAGLFRIA